MGNLDKDTVAKAYRGFRTKIEAVVEVNGNFFNRMLTKKKTRYSLSLSRTLRIVEVRSAALFLSAQAQFRSHLPAD